jgi:hypothetical protein
MTVGKIVQGAAVGQQAGLGIVIQPHPQVDIASVPLQHRVQFQNLVHKRHSYVYYYFNIYFTIKRCDCKDFVQGDIVTEDLG